MDDTFLTFQDFTVVPVKHSSESTETHYLYVKEDSGAGESRPQGRTLFVLNVPPYFTESCLSRLFCECGKVISVQIQKKPSRSTPLPDKSEFFPNSLPTEGFKVAYIVFRLPLGVENAKKLSFKQPRVLDPEKSTLRMGIKKWCDDYTKSSRCDVSKLQTEINQYMEDYDNRQKEEAELAREETEPDEDGWVTVTRHSKNKAVPNTEAVDNKLTRRQKRKLKEREMINFYSFQMRESKREHIAELRKKFEEDKQRISLMKAQRKFRPY